MRAAERIVLRAEMAEGIADAGVVLVVAADVDADAAVALVVVEAVDVTAAVGTAGEDTRSFFAADRRGLSDFRGCT